MDNFYNINGCTLDSTQIEAIEADNKSVLLVAGAGSGKTLTILGKIKYLIEVKNYKEEEILCISFTNETVASLVKKIPYDVNVFTFHKLGLSILGNSYSIVDDKYLPYIIDEYFNSIIYDDVRRKELKRVLYFDGRIDRLLLSREYFNLKRLILTFIKLAKGDGYSLVDLYSFYKRTLFMERIILKYIIEIFILYSSELRSINKIDFDDMISMAKTYVKDANLKYKYIIIDEFQDTSFVRYSLIKEIIKYTDSKIFVVGDDYQSIYRFSGCNLDIFLNFNKYFEDAKTYYLRYTYRNSNQLIFVSCSFIMKNKLQLKKNIESSINLDKPIKVLIGYSFKKCLSLIEDQNDILVIGRNNSDIQDIPWDNKLTIHRSKGLEAKNVILVNSDSIPSLVENDKLLRFVITSKDYLLYEEERRLFYVALTRTKSNIFILVNKKISPFVEELLISFKSYIEVYK